MASAAGLKFRITANADQFDAVTKRMQKSFDKTVRSMEQTGKKLTKNLTVPIGLMALAAGKAAIDFESAFAGVRKTVDATEAEFAGLRKGILDMSKVMPTSANEIAGVAEAAGQFGIQTDKILEFSKTMIMLGETTNLTSDQAATSFARIANVMQIPQDKFDEMGSTVVDLGNNFVTTEAEIVEFANRIAGAGKIAGLSADQVFAISSAFSSVGIKAEAGGTAVQKALLNINDAVARGTDDLTVFAETAGMSAGEFQTAWREDAGKAFTAFVNGLGKQGDNATKTLEQVGLNSERVRTAFLNLSGAGDLLNRTMDTSSKAWQENSALTKEYEERLNTVAAKIAMLWNRIKVLGIGIGDALMPAIENAIEFVGKLTIAFENMSAKSKKQLLILAGALAAGGPLMLAIAGAAKVIAGFAALVMSKFVLIAGAFAVGVGAGQWLIDNWEAIGGRIREEVNSWAVAYQSGFNSILEKAVAFGASLAPNIINPAASVQNELLKIKQGTKDTGIEFTSFGESAKKGIGGIVDAIKGLGAGMLEGTALGDFLGEIEESFKDAGEAAEKATESINRSVQKLSFDSSGADIDVSKLEKVDRTYSSVSERMGDMTERAVVMGQALQSTVTSAITDFATTLGDVFSGDAGAGGFFDGILLLVVDFANKFGKMLVGAGVAALAFKNLLANPVAAIIAGGALIAATTAIKNILAKGPGGGEGSGMNIPQMATGGIIPSGFPNDSYPAMLTSGETVIPKPHPLKSTAPGGGSTPINLYMDSRLISESLIRREDRMNR